MNVNVRPAQINDADLIVYFVRELAKFEKHDPNLVMLTAEKVRAAGFGEAPQFEVLIAESENSEPLGFALFFGKYSTWEAVQSIYIEELYVESDFRKLGVGKKLLDAVCRLAVARDAARVELSVLDWNPARRFYENNGMKYESDWLTYRMERPAIISNAS